MNWINVKDALPLEKYVDIPTFDSFLVTVLPKDADPNDDPEVMILYFNSFEKCFSYRVAGTPYEEEFDWEVTHWMKLPKPADERRNKMSLDVWLTMKGHKSNEEGSGIFVRENGSKREISREEWDRRCPGMEPVIFKNQEEDEEVFSFNITHNLNTMADEAGIYKHLWRPEELGITKAKELIKPLLNGLGELRNNPDKYEKFNPKNGWGTYKELIEFVEEYLVACKKYPEAEIEVSR